MIHRGASNATEVGWVTGVMADGTELRAPLVGSDTDFTGALSLLRDRHLFGGRSACCVPFLLPQSSSQLPMLLELGSDRYRVGCLRVACGAATY